MSSLLPIEVLLSVASCKLYCNNCHENGTTFHPHSFMISSVQCHTHNDSLHSMTLNMSCLVLNMGQLMTYAKNPDYNSTILDVVVIIDLMVYFLEV